MCSTPTRAGCPPRRTSASWRMPRRPPTRRTTTWPGSALVRAARAGSERDGIPYAARMSETPDSTAAARAAADRLAELTGADTHDVALVLGSGWLPAVDLLGETTADLAV